MVAPLEILAESFNSIGNAFIQPIFVQVFMLGLQYLPMLLNFFYINDRQRDQLSIYQNDQESFDFIVVGGGCAGAVVANRLSRNYRVLLLENGGEINPLQLIPLFAQFVMNHPEVDYQYRTVPQKYFDGLKNKQVGLTAGRGLGGSANLNFMAYLRGHVKDFDNWANITHDPSWSWNAVLPYFKMYEDYEIPGDNANHGYGGELRIETPHYTGTAWEFVAAAQELGYPNVDLNGPFSEGFDVLRYPIRRGERQATYKAFLEPIRTRTNLVIRKFAQVNKVLFKPGNIAYGVEYDRHGKTFHAFSTREVILSAGAIGTPKILMLSGIGPQAHLSSLNIPVVSDLPVGIGLKDHVTTLIGPFFLNQPWSINVNRDLTVTQFLKWATWGQGRLTTTSLEAAGSVASSIAKLRGEGDWPDIQLITQCVALSEDGINALSSSFNIKIDDAREYFRHAIDRDACIVGVIASRPRSKGFVKLGGSGAYDIPVIQPNYFRDEGNVDLRVATEGAKLAMLLMENTTAFGTHLGARFTTKVLPGCEGVPYKSDAYLECFVKRFTVSLCHPSGTAAMASVVDSKLRVLGTKNLRVIDQSVSPEQVSVNLMASTLMIAEKGAEIISEAWSGSSAKYLENSFTQNHVYDYIR